MLLTLQIILKDFKCLHSIQWPFKNFFVRQRERALPSAGSLTKCLKGLRPGAEARSLELSADLPHG